MVETPRSLSQAGEWDLSVFECHVCGIDFFTTDHVPLTGLPGAPVSPSKPLADTTKLHTVRSRAIRHTISSTRH